MRSEKGITMLEIVFTAAIILTFAGLILPWQLQSWKRTSGYSRTLSACQSIEKQIEQCRILISMDPEVNYAKFAQLKDTTIWDNAANPPIKFIWKMTSAKDKFGAVRPNIRKVQITAFVGPKDSIVVNTAIAKNF